MGEKLKQMLKLSLSSTEDEEEKLFYETIEAPKFVDFTRPNHFCPDDGYWFCSRVGCDRKHEEEMDSEAVYKKFVLRVMAARSPNVRLRKALSRRPPSESKQCPLSAPPKPSKSRIPRLALVSSISKKLVLDEKGTAKAPPEKPSSTPKARVKHVAAKYMTSPRKKKGGSPNATAFRSVRNPKRTSITIPKNRVVSKALVFKSPRKALKVKRSAELELVTPITKLCQGIKKLEITSQKKGTAQKVSKECRSVRKLLPLDASRKKPSSCKGKTQQDDSSCSRICKSKTKRNDEKKGKSVLDEARDGDETSDMETDEKSRAGSLEVCSATVELKADNICEGDSRNSDSNTSQEENTSSSERPLTGESSSAVSSNTLMSGMISSEDRVSVPENPVAFEAPNVDEQTKAKKDSAAEDDVENQKPGAVRELTDNDDKENAMNSDDIRNLNGGNLSKRDAPVKRKIKTVQTPQTVEKTMKENCSAGTGTQGVKYRKLKTTNPKPFRLRTDERGILKEATQERKANSHENATAASENSQCTSNGVSENREKEGKKGVDRSCKKDLLKPIKSKYKTSSMEVEPKPDRDLGSEKSSRQTRTPFKQLARPQREKVPDIKSGGLGVIEETRATTLKQKESRKQSKLAAQGRRPATIPREPNFQSLHKPKCCTKNIVE